MAIKQEIIDELLANYRNPEDLLNTYLALIGNCE